MTYKRKTQDEYVLLVNYGDTYGYEEEVVEDTRQEILQRSKEYRENCPEYPTKIIKRRVKIEVKDV